MQKNEIERARILKKIALKFSHHRRRNNGRRSYPPTLRNLVLSAVDVGASAESVAKAAGISPQSVGNWRTTSPVVAPQELKVVTTRKARRASPTDSAVAAATDDPSARIVLCSGAVIELPVAALTASLIVVLNGGGEK